MATLKPMTVPEFRAAKSRGQKLAVLTCYDYTSAKLLDGAGVDALLVGDSLQGSLRAQSERRLGWVDHALVAPRFYRQALAAEVAESAGARVTPSLLLQGTCAAGQKTQRRLSDAGDKAKVPANPNQQDARPVLRDPVVLRLDEFRVHLVIAEIFE